MNTQKTLLLIFIVFVVTACDKSNDNTASNTGSDHSVNIDDLDAELTSTVERYTTALFESGANAISLSRKHAQTLSESVVAFLDTPSETSLKSAQENWLEAILAYREFYFYRHLSQVAPETFPKINKLDNQIASFPIQPGFLDKVGEYKFSGLVHDIGTPINAESLINQHGLTDASDVVLGLYAIEFLLFNAGAKREVTDFIDIAQLNPEYKDRGFESIDEIPNNRRRQLLTTQMQMLISDLAALEKNWSSRSSSSARSLWDDIYFGRMAGIASESIAFGLSKIMLEINEFSMGVVEKPTISETIKAHDFNTKQKFIGNALQSFRLNTQLISYERKSKLEEHLSKAIEMTAEKQLTNDENEQSYWKALFSQVKNAGSALI